MHVCMRACGCVCVCVWIYIYVYIYICMCVCVCICILSDILFCLVSEDRNPLAPHWQVDPKN